MSLELAYRTTGAGYFSERHRRPRLGGLGSETFNVRHLFSGPPPLPWSERRQSRRPGSVC